jgi:uncharacterized protein YjbJ (UPF0337 family)
MNKDTIKGTMDDVAGRTKRQVGEWTGNTNTQVNGAAQQVKGKFEKAVGNVKDAARDADKNALKNAKSNQEMETETRERQRLEEERKHHQTIGS